MDYIDGFVLAVSDSNREAYIAMARRAADAFKDHGALRVVECWADDVPEGKLTSFPMAVQRAPGESVVFSWIAWPSRAVRDAGMKAVMADPRMDIDGAKKLFDAQRMIWGGFQTVVDV